MDFKNANELLTLCEEQNISISEVMRNREIITVLLKKRIKKWRVFLKS